MRLTAGIYGNGGTALLPGPPRGGDARWPAGPAGHRSVRPSGASGRLNPQVSDPGADQGRVMLTASTIRAGTRPLDDPALVRKFLHRKPRTGRSTRRVRSQPSPLANQPVQANSQGQ